MTSGDMTSTTVSPDDQPGRLRAGGRHVVARLRAVPTRRWVLLVGLVLIVWVAACGLLLGRAALDLRDGRAAARRAQDDLSAQSVAAGTPIAPLREAAVHLHRAAVATGNPVLTPLRYLPVLGRQLRSVHALSAAVAEVSDAAAEGVGSLKGVIDGGGLKGSDRVKQLQILDAAVSKANARVQAVDQLGPRAGLIGPLASARNEVATQLAKAKATLADATAGTGAGLRLLQGPQRYLLVAANNAEMRAGSGMWLSAALLTSDDGKLTLGPMKPSYEYVVPNGAVSPTGDLAARWGWLHPETEWRNLMTSPDFPSSAALAARMWAAAGGGAVDGVLVVDPVGLRALVAATGPITLPDGSTETVDQVVPDLLHNQYIGIQSDDDQLTSARKDRLGLLAGSIFSALDAGQWSPATLANELGDAIGGRHVLAWSSHPEDESGWEAAGMSGQLTPDTLAVSLLNTGANKLDWFTHLDDDLTIVPGATTTSVRVTVKISDLTPPTEASYVAGPNPALVGVVSAGDYRGLLAVTVPGAATDVKIDGVDSVDVAGRDGPTRVVGGTLIVRRGATRQVTVTFTLPGRVGSMLVEPSGRVPAAQWHDGPHSWQDVGPHVANW
ncbi:MAG TPA: DUF4012 domain-containing protein [Acidimicrobiales bacterium]